MIEPRLFLCSGIKISADDPRQIDRKVVELDAIGNRQNVHLVVEDVVSAFQEHLSPRLVDLLEIAAYVYTADCATRRGTEWSDDDTKEAWDRNFYFVIPVRDIAFWKKAEVQQSLIELLSFLSNDEYQFDFCPLTTDRPKQLYLDLSEKSSPDWPFSNVKRVLMFSGGLDSLAGAIETAANGDNLVLVSHRPVIAVDKRQQKLVQELKRTSSSEIIHIPIWVNKKTNFGREHTQRTRSFLFSSLGTVIAESVGAGGVRFFENGIVSLNLPVADEVLRARASRTTHPISLALMTKFFRLVTERDFVVDNPFIFYTKTEVVSIIAKHGYSELIPLTCSCGHPGLYQSKNQWHCGTCSQCIDRRVAVYAAGLEKYDPDTDYVVDVFTGLIGKYCGQAISGGCQANKR